MKNVKVFAEFVQVNWVKKQAMTAPLLFQHNEFRLIGLVEKYKNAQNGCFKN